MSSRSDRPRTIVVWLFTILAAVLVVALLAELVSLYLAAGGPR